MRTGGGTVRTRKHKFDKSKLNYTRPKTQAGELKRLGVVLVTLIAATIILIILFTNQQGQDIQFQQAQAQAQAQIQDGNINNNNNNRQQRSPSPYQKQRGDNNDIDNANYNDINNAGKQRLPHGFVRAVRRGPSLAFDEYESLALIDSRSMNVYVPPLTATATAAAKKRTPKFTPLVIPKVTKEQGECANDGNGDGNGGGGNGGEPWVDYVVMAPDEEYLDQHLVRFLYYVEADKIWTRDCRVRVLVVLTPKANKKETLRVCNEWSAIAGIPLDFITTQEKTLLTELAQAAQDAAKIFPDDIFYFADVAAVVPPGFAGLVRDNARRGKAVFMPAVHEFGNASATDYNISRALWTVPDKETLYNVGVYAQDVATLKMYADSERTPLAAAQAGGFNVASASVPGLLKPFTRLPTNEKDARRRRGVEEAAKNSRHPKNKQKPKDQK